MGILDSIKGKVDELDRTYNPVRKAVDSMEAAAVAASNPQTRYEAQERRMNRNNPFYADEVRQTPTGAVQKKSFPEK